MAGAVRAVALAIVLVSATAAADRGAAERYFRAGERAYHAQDFESAAQEFELAYQQLDLPEIAFSAAQAYRRQFRVDPQPRYVQRAIALYQVYLKHVKTGGRVADAADGLGEMEREADKLGLAGRLAGEEGAQTSIGVSVLFADALDASRIGAIRDVDEAAHAAPAVTVTATIDGQPWPVDKLEATDAGEHLVRAEAPGYQPQETAVKVVAGLPDLVELTLQPLPAHLVVNTEAGARISIDGRAAGIAPLAAIGVASGRHLVVVTARGRVAAGDEIELERAQTAQLAMPLEPTRRRRAVPWVAGSAIVLGAASIAATVGALYWNHEARDLRDAIGNGNATLGQLRTYDDDRDHRDFTRDAALATGGLALGVGLAAAWLYYFDAPSGEGVHVRPVAGPGGAGALISGRF
jgi:hypothetical protein